MMFQNQEPDASTATQGQDALTKSAEKASEDLQKTANEVMSGELTGVWDIVQEYAVPAITALLILIVGYFVAQIASRMAAAPVRRRVDETLGRFLGKLVFYSILLFTVLGVLGMFGVSVTSFAAVIGAAGFAIGLAFQGTLSNFSSGVLLLTFRPFKVGDVITAAGITGKVEEIDLFVTVMNSPDNRRFIVPNSSITGGTIENITFHSERRVDVSVGVDYSASLDKTREVLAAAAEQQREKLIDGENRGYQIVLGELGDSAVLWTVRFWTTGDDFWGVKEQLTADIKRGLDHAGIGIPFPQMDVHVRQSES